MSLSHLKVKPDLFKSKLMSEKVADVLRENIVSGTLKAGEKLKENQIANILNISRPPIREAFRILAAEGLVILIPRKGAFVSKLSIQEAREIYTIRSMIESFAARLAIPIIKQKQISELELTLKVMERKIEETNPKEIRRVNIEFHKRIVEMSENQRLISFYKSILLPIRRYQKLALPTPPFWKISLDEHKKILEAIKCKNIELAEKLSREHITRTISRIISELKMVIGEN